MRILRIENLLASSALGLALILSGQPGYAQAPERVAAVPIPDTDQLPPVTLKDIDAAQPAPAATPAPAAATPAPAVSAPTLASADTALSDRLRDQVTNRLDRSLSRKNERTAVENFYRDRNYAPLWAGSSAAETRAKAAADYLAKVDRDGLDPAEYPVPDFKSAADADALAAAEIKMTTAVLTYARHALNGRIAWSRVSSDIFFNGSSVEPQDVLRKVADANDVAATLDSFEPQHRAYQALKKALADARSGTTPASEPEKKAEIPPVKVPEGKMLRPGMKDDRVLALRQRLDVPGDKDNRVYDAAVAEAVKKFQRSAELNADGNLGAATVRALNGHRPSTPATAKLGDPVDTIIVNMDRWRWYARDLGNPHVVVNIPDFRLTLYKDSKVYWTTKIVVGKPNLPTPLITAEMKFITVNPTWNVPPSIVEKEYLPALQEDPQALERIGLKINQAPDGTIHIYQPPGAGNALGRIRFNFPNKFLVYQHDTPDKHLFSRDTRAFSHGCMRVENPLMYGEKLLSLVLPNEHYSAARLEKMFGGSEININFPNDKFIQVHLTYQTAFVDEDGKLQLRPDVYGRDGRMMAMLKGSERKVADIAVERSASTSAKPVRLTPGMYGPAGYRGGGGFFDFLFGPPQPRYYEQPRRGRVSFR